jgi:HEAT repeat protein
MAVRALAEGLEGSDEVRLESVRTLAFVAVAPVTESVRKEAQTELTRALGNQDAIVQLEAAAAVARTGSTEAFALLERRLDEGLPGQRVEAVRALARIPGRRAMDLLKWTLDHRDVAVQVEAANALAKQGYAPALDKLEDGLNNEWATVRLAARQAIVRLPRQARDEILPEVVSLALRMWAAQRELRVPLYESLLEVVPRLYWQVGIEEWPEWCERLEGPTSWMWQLASESADSPDSLSK